MVHINILLIAYKNHKWHKAILNVNALQVLIAVKINAAMGGLTLMI